MKVAATRTGFALPVLRKKAQGVAGRTRACAAVVGLLLAPAKVLAQNVPPSESPPSEAAKPEIAQPEAVKPESAKGDPSSPVPAPVGPKTEEQRADFTSVVQAGTVAVKAPRCWQPLPWTTQRSLALLATLGSYSGFGLGVRVGTARVGFDGSYGFLPILATFQQERESSPTFRFLSGGELSAAMYVGLHRTDPRTDLGITFGYKYHTLLGHGGTAAFYIKRELAAHWTLQLFIGPSFFPDAEDAIRRETGWRYGSVSSGIAVHQGGGGVSLAFFP